jgi:phenylalanyl-tRNA synthetase alpha chain
LRTHTSAHQTHFISSGVESFLCTGDVYRRDEIDASHYPVFHQMEGVRIFKRSAPEFAGKSEEEIKKVSEVTINDA